MTQTPTNSSSYFFFGLLLSVIVLTLVMFVPFLTPVVLAAALSVIFGRMHRAIQRSLFKNKERSSIAAILTLIIVAIIVLVPVLLITGKIYVEVQGMYAFLTDEAGRSQVISALNGITESFSHAFFDLYPPYSFDALNVTDILSRGLQWLFSNIDTVFTSMTRIGLGVFIMFLALFYFLRDGRELKRQIIAISPLGDVDDERILRKMQQAVYSIFGGSIAVGVIQGFMTGIGFAIFGVPNPAVWGSIAAVSALIPGIGTALVLVPGILYLFFTGHNGSAIGLLVWATIAVGLIDNVLGPIFMNRGVKIHPFLILLSVLGGLAFFGPIGFVLGPIILALLFALLEIYRTTFSKRETAEGSQTGGNQVGNNVNNTTTKTDGIR